MCCPNFPSDPSRKSRPAGAWYLPPGGAVPKLSTHLLRDPPIPPPSVPGVSPNQTSQAVPQAAALLPLHRTLAADAAGTWIFAQTPTAAHVRSPSCSDNELSTWWMCDAGNFKASNHHFCPFLIAKPFNTHPFDSLFSFSDPPPLPPFSHPHPYRTLAPNKLQTPLARASGSIPADFALWSLTHTRSTLPDNPTALPFPRLSPTQTHQNSLPSPATAPFYKRSLPYVVPLIGPQFFLGNLSWPFFVRLKPAWLEPFGASWRRVNGSLSGTECGGGQRDCWTLNVMRREWCGGPMRCGGEVALASRPRLGG